MLEQQCRQRGRAKGDTVSDRVYFNFILYQLELYDTINQQELLAKRFAEHLQSSSNSNCTFSYLTFCNFFFSYFCFVCSCHKRKAICSVSCSRCPFTTLSRHPLAAPTLVAPSILPLHPLPFCCPIIQVSLYCNMNAFQLKCWRCFLSSSCCGFHFVFLFVLLLVLLLLLLLLFMLFVFCSSY